ncbi:MAG: DUF1588 domain-containing protein [Lentisphaerales bacterium]|nr:DUF1588 domain-containing protein [Lentisphaerales bacterium]
MSALEPKTLQLFEKYCFDCHSDGIDKGNFEFDKIMKQPLHSPETRKTWHKIWDVIEEHQMPPANKKKQPTKAEREEMLIGLEVEVFSVKRDQRYAGPISLVRMSNEQYGNFIKDLTGAWYNVSNQLPLDPTSSGFNNITATLNISPLLFERYTKIAQQLSQGLMTGSKDSGLNKRGVHLRKSIGDGKDFKKVRDNINYIAKKSFRRPLVDDELNGLMKIYTSFKKSHDHNYAMIETLKAIMTSPNFLFRTELLGVDKVEGNIARLDEFALASRLAFFLWNSGPDDHLLNLAEQGKLRANLDTTVVRMIKDWRFIKMVESFGQYWLGIQYLQNNVPSRRIFKDFDRQYLSNMKQETTKFLHYLFQENKSINEIFSSRETFVNRKLANYYGVKFTGKNSYQKVTMPEKFRRRGILTQPSVLLVTSDPDRTSPVKRGLWILENLLGMQPPPAPPDVTTIDENAAENKNLTLRQKLEKHRNNKACASCHAMMDPLGFTMDNFNAVGQWREQEHGKPLDVKSNWRGHQIDNFDDLYKLITTKYRNEFLSCFTEKLMNFALGRGMEIEDRIAINKIVRQVEKPDSKFHDLFIAVVKSTPFQYRSIEKKQEYK